MTTTNTKNTTTAIYTTIVKIIWFLGLSVALPGGAIALGIIFRRLLLP